MLFSDRIQAGQALASLLADSVDREDALLLALPRGGVPVAAEIASALHLPLDILLVRKLGIPGHDEFAMGAIAAGSCYLDQPLIDALNILPEQVQVVMQREQLELQRRTQAYGGTELALHRRSVILVDDGLATGATMRAAIGAARHYGAQTVIVAVPVAAAETVRLLEDQVDQLVCPHVLESFRGVGQWYDDFRQVTDDEVIELLHRYRERTDP